MKRLAVCLALTASCLVLDACSLDFVDCGTSGVNCGGEDSVCICATGKCAEPDEDCRSGLHYVGGRCVSVTEAPTAIESTPLRPRLCSTDGGGDTSDAHDLGGIP
jgi:hypothetical protein